MNFNTISEYLVRGVILLLAITLSISWFTAIYDIIINKQGSFLDALLILGLGSIPAIIILAVLTKPESKTEPYDELIQSIEESDQFICCKFNNRLSDATQAMILVDLETDNLSFLNCATSTRFLPKSLESVSCAVKDLKGIQEYRERKVDYLAIFADTFKAEIPHDSQNYEKLLQYLKAKLPLKDRVFAMQNPLMPYTFIASTLVGIGLGVSLTPIGTSDQWLGITVISCAIGMALLNYLSIKFVQDVFQYDMTFITGSIVLCLTPGIQLAFVAMYLFDINLVMMAGIVCISLLLGLILGILKKPLF